MNLVRRATYLILHKKWQIKIPLHFTHASEVKLHIKFYSVTFYYSQGLCKNIKPNIRMVSNLVIKMHAKV